MNDRIDELMNVLCDFRESFENRMGNFEKKMDNMESRMGNFEKKMDNMESRMGNFEKKMVSMENRMDSFEKKMDSMESRMDSFKKKMDGMENRMDNFEHRMDSMEKRFEQFVKLTENSFASLIEDNKKIYKKLEEHDQHLHKIESKIFTIKRLATENSLEIDNIKNGII